MISIITLLAQSVRQQAKYQSGPIASLSMSVADSILGPEPAPAPQEASEEDDYYENEEVYTDSDDQSYEEPEEVLYSEKKEEISLSLGEEIWKNKQFRGVDKKALREFRKYHEERPEIFQSFYTLASKTKLAGNNKYSAKCLMEVIRWQQDLQAPGGFKINNNYTSLYARLLMAADGLFEGFFELRDARGPSAKKK